MNLFYTMVEWFKDFASDIWGWVGAAVGVVFSFLTGLPALTQAVMIAQVADILTGLACAVLGKSQKSESGKVSSRVMLEGVIKKFAEWMIIWVCICVGSPLGMEGVSTAAMTYVIATELVSLMENFELLGLKVPLLQAILDVAHGKQDER